MDETKRTVLDKFRLGLLTTGMLLEKLGAPKKSFATPPEMALEFADRALACVSLDDFYDLIDKQRNEAAAFFSYADGALTLTVKSNMELPTCIDEAEFFKVTANGLKWIFLEIQRQYPDGLITDEN